MLATPGSNQLAVKSPVPKTYYDFALAEAWCFGNVPVVRARTAVDRGLGWGESKFHGALRPCAGKKVHFLQHETPGDGRLCAVWVFQFHCNSL